MENFTTDELKLIAQKRGIENYQNMPRKKLIKALDKTKRNFKDITLKKLDQITKIHNLSQDELEQIEEELLIALLKSNQHHTKLRKSQDNNTETGETKKFFSKLKKKFSKEEIKKIRRKFRFKESIDEYLKELGQKDSLTKQEKQEKKRCTEKLQKPEEFFKKLKEDLNRLKKYQYSDD